MNRNILFLLFILLIGILEIRKKSIERFREGQGPKPSKRQLASCTQAKAFWEKRDQNLMFRTMAMKMGLACNLPPCRGGAHNNWECQPPPPPPKSTKEQKASCDRARTMWNNPKREGNAVISKLAVMQGAACLAAPCRGSPKNDWRCQDGEEDRKKAEGGKEEKKSASPPPPPPPPKPSPAQLKSCRAAKTLWEKRNEFSGNMALAMRTNALKMGALCSMKPCGGGPGNDWKCEEQEGFDVMEEKEPCTDKQLKEIRILERRLKAAKKSCSENSASSAFDGGIREGFREGQIQRAREVDSRGRQQALGTQEQIKSCDAARLFYNYESPSWRFLQQCTTQYRPCGRYSCPRNRFLQVEQEAKRREDTRIRDTATAVGQACTTCGGSPANNRNCTGEGVKDGNPAAEKLPGPTPAQRESCKAAQGFFAQRNKDPAMLARAMEVGTLCNSCGGNPENNYTCAADRQAAAKPVVARAKGATASSSSAAEAAGAARCTKCDPWTIARNLGDQYKNDPNICKSRKDEAQCADAGGLWNDEVATVKKPSGGKHDWKIEMDKKTGNLVFNYNGERQSQLTKDGEWSSKSRKCGTWNIRNDRIGIPERGDIHLHTDGWQRAFTYDAPYGSTAYNKGGFAGRELWYAGSAGGKITK